MGGFSIRRSPDSLALEKKPTSDIKVIPTPQDAKLARFTMLTSRLPRRHLNPFTFVILVIFCAILLQSRLERRGP